MQLQSSRNNRIICLMKTGYTADLESNRTCSRMLSVQEVCNINRHGSFAAFSRIVSPSAIDRCHLINVDRRLAYHIKINAPIRRSASAIITPTNHPHKRQAHGNLSDAGRSDGFRCCILRKSDFCSFMPPKVLRASNKMHGSS